MQQKMKQRLVLFPLPYVGHQNPMFNLGNILHSRGFSISVIHTRFHSPNTSKYPHFSFHFIEDGFSETEASFDEIIATLILLNTKCVESFKACLSQIVNDALNQEPVACLITDAVCHFTQSVADDLKVPRIVLRTGCMAWSSMYFSLDCGRIDLTDKEPEDFIPDHHPLRFKDVVRLDKTDQSPLQDLTSNEIREYKASRGIIFDSLEEIQIRSLATLRKDLSLPIFPIGPFHKWPLSPFTTLANQDQSCLSWLDTQAPNSVLYVSFGSVVAINEAGFLEMAWGLANSNQPFLWVVRSDLVHSKDGSSKLPDAFLQEVSGRSYIVEWAPQKAVLAHPAVGGFWTHCGWSSTLESICEGVPMICSPSFADQMINTRHVTEGWKIGLRLEKGSKTEDIEKTIKILMAEKEGEEMRERAACLKNKATNCLEPKGSSWKNMEDLVNLIMSF